MSNTIEQADQLLEYLAPQIATAKRTAKAATKEVLYKQLGLDYIEACKEISKDQDGNIIVATLKSKVNDAIVLLQSYHDALVEE